jgi:hypothetical protein
VSYPPSASSASLTDVTTDMVITKEETFGPVAPLYRFKTDAEAIEMANDAAPAEVFDFEEFLDAVFLAFARCRRCRNKRRAPTLPSPQAGEGWGIDG